MKILKILTLAILIWFAVVSNITIYDDEIKYVWGGIVFVTMYLGIALVWYKTMRLLGFGPLFTQKRAQVNEKLSR